MREIWVFGSGLLAAQNDDTGLMDWVLIGLGVLAAILLVAALAFFLTFGKLWLQAYSSDCPVKVKDFIGMYLRKINPRIIVDVLVM
ncbi:MAG: UPF0365 family protein, partial [Planctomycetota bacterium]|nr:UPF0365 family protein [Planctomycetota bacterium]